MAGIGYGTTLTGATTGLIGEVLDISGPNQTVDSVETTSMDSVAAAKDFIAGLIDAGEATFAVNFDGLAAGTADTLQTALAGRVNEAWTFAYPDGETNVATGFISALGIEVPIGDRMTQPVTIKFTGSVVFTDQA